ncbi:UDP-glycosyltransferase UGT5-like [Schistocerca americana]|uniref:UDP-glycosyltransferase UGT5-like n=1 Tax=Schistocerca americana TaxID=7009 RepID=UPI001F4F8E6C|nr:UDP-glycosyltransferase UGT5-like [Schistocerca americana]
MAPSQTKAVVAVLLLLMRLPEAARTANVLVVFPMGARSHWNLGRAIAMGLHAQGHHITAVTPFSGQGPPTNWTDVPLPNLIHFFGHTSGLFDLGKTNDFQMFVELVNYGVNSCEVYLQDENFKRLLKSGDKFDVMIMEEFFCECFLPLAHKFDIPVIGFTTFAPSAWQGDIVGNPSPYSYVPDTFLTYTDHMTFFERLHNTLYVLFCKVIREMYMMPRQEALVQKYLPDLKMPSLFEMEKRTSMVLTNSHFSLFYPKPLVPAMVEVGGMHVSLPKKLPQDLQEFLDGAKDGAILFSMGSNLKSADLPEEKRLAIVETFSKLKQRVLFKWEAETFPGKPTNMKVGKWLPQSDILAHKNVRLFITHGGLLSTLEAMYHGVPVIGIPIFCDQELNMLQAEAKGYGLKLHFSNITSDTFSWTISEVLNNSRYKTRAQELSRLFHDRPRTPLEEVVYWTEYVVRHKGAPHMRSASLDLAWYQLCLLDVVGAVAAAAALALWILVVVLRTVFRLLGVSGPKTTAKGSTTKSKKLA